jgi:hypothetical protein
MNIKQTLVLVFLIASFLGTAQITKGNFLVGGNGSFSYTKTDNSGSTQATKAYDITLAPNFGYFFIDKLASGIRIDFFYTQFESGDFKSKIDNTKLGPFIRYYFLNSGKNLNLFIEPSFTFNISGNLNRTATSELKAGMVYFLNSVVGFETTLSYAISNFENTPSGKSLFLGLGFQIHLEKNN